MAEKNEQVMLKSIGIAVAIVILSVISALVVGSILDSSAFTQTITGTNTNESLSNVTNITNVTFAIISSQPAATCTLSSIVNATSGAVLNAGNYTFYPAVCNIILTSGSAYIGETLNATYGFSYTEGGLGIISISDTEALFGEFIIGLLGFLGIIGIVLGVVWLIIYVARLFSKGGLNDLGQTA